MVRRNPMTLIHTSWSFKGSHTEQWTNGRQLWMAVINTASSNNMVDVEVQTGEDTVPSVIPWWSLSFRFGSPQGARLPHVALPPCWCGPRPPSASSSYLSSGLLPPSHRKPRRRAHGRSRGCRRRRGSCGEPAHRWPGTWSWTWPQWAAGRSPQGRRSCSKIVRLSMGLRR